MNKIAPHLWFDQNAMEAAEFYVSVFDDSRINSVSHYFDGFFPDDFEGIPMPDGTVLFVEFELCGQTFGAVNGGPVFQPNSSISFYVLCESIKKLDTLWYKLSMGGKELMALDKYPFSERFGWIEDRFGVSWQLILSTGQEKLNRISPCFLFTDKANGRAEEAMHFYSGAFPDAGTEALIRYGKDGNGDEGTVMHAEFNLAGQSFIAMDSSLPHPFAFNEGISLMVFCKTQEEVDFFWDKFTKEGREEPCGWLRDKFGVAWQIVPSVLSQLTDQSDRERAKRVNHALLTMKKINIQQLWDAYHQK